MDIRAAVREMRDLLAPEIDDFSLEMIDVVIADGEWDVAHAMAAETAASYQLELPTELLQAS